MPPPVDIDALCTRAYAYPNYVALTQTDCGTPIVIKASVLGPDAVKLLIEQGRAVPVSQRHDRVASNLRLIQLLHPDLLDGILRMLAQPQEHLNGWFDFLSFAANKSIHFLSYLRGAAMTAPQLDALRAEAYGDWLSWYTLGGGQTWQFWCHRNAFSLALQATTAIVRDAFDRRVHGTA